MDRKSFFKRALFALGAAVVPSVILSAAKKNEDTKFIEGFLQPDNGPAFTTNQDGDDTLYWQMQKAFEEGRGKVVANKFYWAEYEYEPYEMKLMELKKLKNF